MARVGNYTIEKEIATGGFGAIYQARHIYLDEKACIKQNLRASREDAELLLHEAKILWKLDECHSIPSVKDFFEVEKNNCAMVMSFIEGKTLEEIVKEKGPIHPEDVCWIIERVLGALLYAHSHGIIHSDVKPGNIFIEPQKRDIKLIDFGLASYKPKHTTKPIGYTPLYAAPELQSNQPPIPETDMYGVGIVMLHALGGDVAKKSFPVHIPSQMIAFGSQLLRYDPIERPNWDKDNPLERLSDLREKVFGRRHLR